MTTLSVFAGRNKNTAVPATLEVLLASLCGGIVILLGPSDLKTQHLDDHLASSLVMKHSCYML